MNTGHYFSSRPVPLLPMHPRSYDFLQLVPGRATPGIRASRAAHGQLTLPRWIGTTAFIAGVALFQVVAAARVGHAQSTSANRTLPLPSCEWCGGEDAPGNLTAVMQIGRPAGELGAALVLSGTVYGKDGHTPAPNVLVYAYHTDATGVYAKDGRETGNGRRHGRLRGWLMTDASGHYSIITIRPGTYPSRAAPAHVHMTITPPGQAERYIDDVVFSDDPLVDAAWRAREERRGGAGVVVAHRDSAGTWHAVRNIYLGLK